MELAFVSEVYDGGVYSSTYKHPHSLSEYVKGITQEEFELTIQMAITALKSMKHSAQTIEYKDALEKEIKKAKGEHTITLQQKETSLKTNYERQIQELEIQIQKLKSSLTLADYTAAKLREQIQGAEGMFQGSLKEISRQKDTQYEKEIERLTLTHKGMLETMERNYKEQEERLRKQVEKTLISSEKGKQGEKEFDELVTQYTSWGSLENTSKLSHGTDRKATIRNCGVCFELKNYSGEVPGSEVSKFERDMEENHDSPLGVFISMKSGICGKKANGFMTIKWTPRHQMLLYINHLYNHPVEDVLKFIDLCIDTAKMVYDSSRLVPDSGEELVLKGRIEQAKIYIEKEIKRMETFLITLSHQKTFLQETITKHHAEQSYTISQSIAALRSMLEVILGTPIEIKEEPSKTEEQQAKKRVQKKKKEQVDGAL
jgi:hypothetical protein